MAMGVAVLLLQTSEKVIRTCMTYVLQKKTPLTLESLHAQEKSERKKTLGYFLDQLRLRADIQVGFDALLEEFLTNRNYFVHDIWRVPGWGLESPEQTVKAKQFVSTLIEQSEAVTKIFLGLISAWQKQVGVPMNDLSDHEYFPEIDNIYRPLVSQLFMAKDN